MPKIIKDSSFIRILIFFIPLAVSASLTSISHVIINGTLSRADHAEVIIANYAIAFSLLESLNGRSWFLGKRAQP
ncbi:hypothetical protein [Neobacillus drentensis]|uniref:hypothetical protein n=1 Tax=Neobacillus drentensis TaxID=220684 RepID=UPI003003332E